MSNLNYNKVIEAGRITVRPELKTTPSGVSVTTFSLAVKRQRKSNEDISDFFSVTAWRETAEFITRYFDKGSAILIEGYLQTRNWTDQSGQKHYVTEIVAEQARFVDSKDESAASSTNTTPSAAQTYIPSAYTTQTTLTETVADDEELPF